MSNSTRQKRRNPWKSGTTRSNRRTLNGTVFNSKSIKIWGRGGQFLFSAPWFHQPCCYNLEKTVNCKVGWIIWLRKVLAISFFFLFLQFLQFPVYALSGAQTTDGSLFSSKSQTFGLGKTIWADRFWCIWVIFGHFGAVSPLPLFSINQILFLRKTKPLYPNTKYLLELGFGFEFGLQWIKDLAIRFP